MPLICSVYSRIKIPGYRIDWRRGVTAQRVGVKPLNITQQLVRFIPAHFFSLCILVLFDIKSQLTPTLLYTQALKTNTDKQTLFLIWPRKRVL